MTTAVLEANNKKDLQVVLKVAKQFGIYVRYQRNSVKSPEKTVSPVNDYITTPEEDAYDLKCCNKAVKEWEKDDFKSYPMDNLYKEFGVK